MKRTETPIIDELQLDSLSAGTIHRRWLHLVSDGFGESIHIPLIIVRGLEEGPVLGVTAAIHGNELNGIPVIQHLVRNVDPRLLRGTIIGALTLNVPGLMLHQRFFNDGADLNRIAPGRPDGNVSEIYIHRLVQRLLPSLDYLIDLHTASAGRINSWYIRADMDRKATARMARLQNPDIILHNTANDGTFRGTACSMGIEAITLELRDPHIFQFDVIADALRGVENVMVDLNMIESNGPRKIQSTIFCPDSFWLYSDDGGILSIPVKIGQMLEKGQKMAELRDIFGGLKKTYYAPEAGIVIGKSVDPIAQTGSRIIHLGRQPESLDGFRMDKTLDQLHQI